jgi:hypothetical protein
MRETYPQKSRVLNADPFFSDDDFCVPVVCGVRTRLPTKMSSLSTHFHGEPTNMLNTK